MLIHHRHELKALQEETADDVRSRHIRLLFKFLDPFIERVVVPEERRHKKPTPSATFDNLWLLLKPGTFVYETHKNKPIVHCLLTVERIVESEGDNKGKPSWEIQAWNIVASDKGISRHSGFSYIPFFEGEMAITSLMTVPLEYWDAVDGGERRRKLEERGKKFFWLMDTKFKQVMYEGYVPNFAATSLGMRPGEQPRFERDKYVRYFMGLNH